MELRGVEERRKGETTSMEFPPPETPCAKWKKGEKPEVKEGEKERGIKEGKETEMGEGGKERRMNRGKMIDTRENAEKRGIKRREKPELKEARRKK